MVPPGSARCAELRYQSLLAEAARERLVPEGPPPVWQGLDVGASRARGPLVTALALLVPAAPQHVLGERRGRMRHTVRITVGLPVIGWPSRTGLGPQPPALSGSEAWWRPGRTTRGPPRRLAP
ncbi:MAG: hypothetical protein M3Q03_14250 [Chloroflexota bacterium]|nr:hypothetical protein [Chloroflexota bacterium]